MQPSPRTPARFHNMASRTSSVLLLLFSALLSARAQVLRTPDLLIDPTQISQITAEGTCPGAGITEESYRLPTDPAGIVRRCNATSNQPFNANSSTSSDAFWKSQNNLMDNSLTVRLVVPFVINFIQFTLASPPPLGIVASGSTDESGVFAPFMYVVTESSQCQEFFGVDPVGTVRTDQSNLDQPFCLTLTDINPSSSTTLEVRLFDERSIPVPGGSGFVNPRSLPRVVQYFRAQNVRLTFRGFSDPQFPFVAVRRVLVGTHCVCNGHATQCSLLSDQTYECDCQADRFTEGPRCSACQPLYNQEPFGIGVPCERCQCFGHATACSYNASAVGRSLNANSMISGGGVCTDCQGMTQGVNCGQCLPQFYHPSGLPVNLTYDCVACSCNLDGQIDPNAQCADGTGFCTPCKVNVVGDQCEACANNFFNLTRANLDGCEPCNCNEAGTIPGQACNMVTGQCNCKTNVNGRACDTCDATFFNLTSSNVDGCSPCACNVPGSVNNICNVIDGQCPCNSANITGRQCNQCITTSFGFPRCSDCECSLRGQTDRTNLCNSLTGVCTDCKANVDPSNKCEVCRDEFYDLQDSDLLGCKPCDCNLNGTAGGNAVCDKMTGQCVCKTNVVGRRCDTCDSGFTMFNSLPTDGCSPCGCATPGSVTNICNNVTGVCDCFTGFEGDKCDTCAANFFGLPNCRACACNLPGTVAMNSTCESVTGQCDCLSTHNDRQCDQCAADHFGIATSVDPQLACRPCGCNRFGSVNTTCDTLTGQCLCVATTMGVTCDMCVPRHFNITFSDNGANTFGGGCLRCDQCTDDLLSRACEQEAVVINATLRINSTEVNNLIESGNALPGLEDRYIPLRSQTNSWRSAQISQLSRLDILRGIEQSIMRNVSMQTTRVSRLEVLSQEVSGRAIIDANTVNTISQQFLDIFGNINDLSFLLTAELGRLRQLLVSAEGTLNDTRAVLNLNFAMETRAVTYALQNATRVMDVSATQLARAMRNYGTAQELTDRFVAAIAAVNNTLVDAIVQLSAETPGDNVTEERIADAQRLYQTAVADRVRYMQSFALTNNANNAASNALDATQPPLDMLISALQTLSLLVPYFTTRANTIRQELTENTQSPPTTLYQVTTGEAVTATRRAYATEIELLFNSTQPHGADAAEAIIDYQTADDDIANATALLQDTESALDMTVAAAGNVAATQASVEQESVRAQALLATANNFLSFVSRVFDEGRADLELQAQRIANATTAFTATVAECDALFGPIIENFNSISTVAGNIAVLGECATNFTTDLLPRVYQAEVDVTSAEPAAAASVTGAAQANAALPGLEARRVAMGDEVANVTGGLALLQAASTQTTQSLDDLLGRLEFLRTRLTEAQVVYEGARNCCETLRTQSCPNNNNLVRLATTASFVQFDPGHSGAEPFDFNSDFIDLDFRTRESQGVLLYFSSTDQSQYFGLELRNANTLVVRSRRANGGTGVLDVPAPNGGGFDDNAFHSVRVVILSTIFLVGVDSGGFIFGSFSSEGIYTITNAPLYIGGTPPGVVAQGLLRDGELARPALIGCFRNVIYNQDILNILEPSFIGGHVPCNCTLDPPAPTTPPPTTTPPTMPPTLTPCSNVTPAVRRDGVRLNGGLSSQTYLAYARQENDVAPLNFQEGALLSIRFSTYLRDAVLMYISNVDHSYVIALEIRNGYVSTVVRASDGTRLRVSLTSVFVADGLEHEANLVATPTGSGRGILFLVVDNMNNPSNSFQLFDLVGDRFTFNTRNLYIGGAPDPQALLLGVETTRPAFDGCILQFIQQGVALDLTSSSVSLNSGPCFSNSVNGLRLPGFGYALFTVPLNTDTLVISLTLSSSVRGAYLFHGGSATTGTVTAYITPMGMVNARVKTIGAQTGTVSVSPPDTTSTICNGDFIQVTVTVGSSFINLNVGGVMSSVSFDSGAGAFNPAGALIVGQPPAAVVARDSLPVIAGFRGCIRDITVNGQLQDPVTAARSDVGLGCGRP